MLLSWWGRLKAKRPDTAWGAFTLGFGILKGIKDGSFLPYIERISGAVILAASIYLLFFDRFTRLHMPGM